MELSMYTLLCHVCISILLVKPMLRILKTKRYQNIAAMQWYLALYHILQWLDFSISIWTGALQEFAGPLV